ncbi:hydrolase [Mycolicibacterium conceptionense]|uniref:Hydrolase n=1 Tax=Mycolicibacterium conceptionense TaxID=451644 RepID=A0A0J8WX21_9MYCO|nr:NlpC/P60 family protein [Mycolicibacterium conceptionense]KMV17579.1 hydrolase [Mycolicibacterium conceptionense]
MTGPTISTNDAVVQSGSDNAGLQLPTTGSDGKPLPGAVDPRLTTAVDDTEQQNRKGRDKVSDGIAATKKDSKGKTDIDGKGSDEISGVAGTLLTAAGTGASGLLGALGKVGSSAGSAMPSMPQVPASTAGQSNPTTLSNPAVQKALASLLNDPSGTGTSAVGTGTGTGLTGPGVSGGSGTSGPTGKGGNEYEQKIIDLANQVVAANIPYSWGSGGLDGPTQSGTRDGGAADAAGDYAKTGFDCSGLARYLVYQASGVELPRVSGDQYAAGQLVSAADARPGDLAFNTDPSQHVQVYVGDGKVVEAQQSGTNVMFSDVSPNTQFVRVVSSPVAA